MTEGLATLEPGEWLGRRVDVEMDRPLGSAHPRRGFLHPTNYGFVPGTLAADGSEIDAYVVGTDEPLATANGTVVAVVERRDDDEDKLVVAVDGSTGWTAVEVIAATEFQERWFDSHVHTPDAPPLAVASVRMAAKAIVRDADGRVLLVHYPATGDWALTGGGIEPGETDDEALRREMAEETGCRIAEQSACLFVRPVEFEHRSSVLRQIERTYELRLDGDPCDGLTAGADDEGIDELRWWTLDDIAAATVPVYPVGLPDLLAARPRHGVPRILRSRTWGTITP